MSRSRFKAVSDIASAVNRVAQFCNHFGSLHVRAIELILRYLKGTKDHGILYPALTQQATVNVTSYADSNWANDKITRKSRSGYLVTVNQAPVTWGSKRQSLIALPDCEAEYILTCSAIQDTLYIINLLTEIGCQITLPATVYYDHQAALANLSDAKVSCQNKHLDIRVKMMRDNVGQRIQTKYIKSEDNQNDALTKGPTPIKFEKCREKMGVVKVTLLLMFPSLIALNLAP